IASGIAGYLASTCKVLTSFEQGGPLPSLAGLRDAGRSDLELLPKTFLEYQLKRADNMRKDAIATAYLTATAVYALRDGKRLLAALGSVPDGVDLSKTPLDCEATPVAAVTYMLTVVAKQLAGGQPLSRDYGERRGQYGFALKSILHNLAYTQIPWPQCAGSGASRFKWLRQVYGAVLAVDRTLVTVGDLRDEIGGEPGSGDTTESRALAVIDGLFNVADVLVRIPSHGPDSLSRTITSLRNVATALVRRELGSVIYWTANTAVELKAVDSPVLDGARPYLMLIVDIAQAENSEG